MRSASLIALALALASCGRSEAPSEGAPDAPGSAAEPKSAIPHTPAPLAAGFSADFRYWHLSEDEAKQLYPLSNPGYRYDPFTGFCRRPNQKMSFAFPDHAGGSFEIRTDALSLRRDGEPAEQRPSLRVLVTGDSHTDGACDNSEHFAQRLELMLRSERGDAAIEVLNAGMGSFSFYNYLGQLEKHAALRPHAFVICVYGGNDWGELLGPWHHYHGTQRPEVGGDYRERMTRTQKLLGGWGAEAISQGYNQYIYFQHQPDQAELALRAAEEVTREIHGLCERLGVRLIVAYLPPAMDTQREAFREGFEPVEQELGLAPESRAITAQLASRYLAWLREQGIEGLDLTPSLAQSQPMLYWKRDLHINVDGHQRVAEALRPLFAQR